MRLWMAWIVVALTAVACTKSKKTLPPEVKAKFDLATALVRADDKAKFAEAETLLAGVIQVAPDYQDAKYWQAQMLMAWSDALTEEAVYLAAAEKDLGYLVERAEAQLAAAETDEAKGFAEVLATSIRERHEKVQATLEEWTRDAEKHKQRGLALVESEIEGKPDAPYEAHRVLADYYRIQGNHDKAKSELEIVRKLNPESAGLQFVQGVMMLKVDKDLDGAVKSMDQALTLDPAFVKARYYKGLALAQQDEKAAAETAMKAVLAQSPDHIGAKTYMQIADFVQQATEKLETTASAE